MALVQCFSVVLICLLVNHALSLSLPEAGAAILIMFLVAVNGSLIGLLISSLVSTPEKALTLFPLILIPELLLCGLFLPVRPVQTIIPITVEQLMEGKMFAQPDAKAKAEQILQPCKGVPYPALASGAPTGAGANPAPSDETAAAEAQQGRFAHQVAGAMTPSPEVANCFHRFTPAPDAGMGTPVRWLSSLAISRWGLESLSDLCVHGAHSTQDYAYKILNTITISLHPDDVARLEEGLEKPAEAFAASGAFPLPSNFWRDKGPYLAIMSGYALLMLVLILVVMKRKDVK